MVQVSQTEEDIKISIELNRLVTRKPDVVLLPQYLKFNNPPIFFERHLAGEIDEMASFCRIFKREARIVLVKKQKGIWPEIFQTLSKELLLQKRLEIADLIVERNKQRDEQALERYAIKRRNEIQKEVNREAAIKERVKQFQENACQEALMVGTRKETHAKSKPESRSSPQPSAPAPARLATPNVRPIMPMASVRGSGRISVCFSNQHKRETPKRESQEAMHLPFTVEGGKVIPTAAPKSAMDSVDE
ncbi:uncharacterized protein Dwil_GK15243 [Drosophila willistoni]|uniref:Dynein axonemal assembly factor 4 n=1 Tax=Drosophila willistoni TaxID=7260 RepID=B4MWE7_DROWI|nr:dynein axonemal assembly factor 4 [Drosophila willistoni]EDW76017.1 uncharacterized protein Dwil_GK15243 [Drosophila willistoni]